MGLSPRGCVTTGDPVVQTSGWKRTPDPHCSESSLTLARPKKCPLLATQHHSQEMSGPEDAWQKLFRKLSVWNPAHTETFA